MTISQARKHIALRLTPTVGEAEAQAMAKMILEEVKGYTAVELVMHADRELLDATIERIRCIVDSVLAGQPLQYALGVAWFRGRRFAVDSSVLIPRPETSQLVDIIVDDYAGRSDLHILDIGTGSGCIAISLALDLPFAKVDAIDISSAALQKAMANASSLKARVTFTQADAMHLEESGLRSEQFDIVVSNPPYVLESERADMDPRVKDYEPSLALFVPDQHPVEIYRKIGEFAHATLRCGGRIYLEINPLCADDVKSVLRQSGFSDVEILRDYKGNLRFARASKNN